VAFTAAFLQSAAALNAVIWGNAYLRESRWAIPVLTILLSLVVGLAQKYLHAPTVIDGGFAESLKGKGLAADYRTLPGALLSAFCSLLSGASVGPEGPVAVLVLDIAAWMRHRLRIAAGAALGFDVAALASAFNGIVGNPLFTGIFATEYGVGAPSASRYLVWNLIAGVIGFAFYEALGLTAFAGLVAFAPVTHLEWEYFAWAIVLGVVGCGMALPRGRCGRCHGGAYRPSRRLRNQRPVHQGSRVANQSWIVRIIPVCRRGHDRQGRGAPAAVRTDRAAHVALS
jgi:H+/Cl- antiporter ClcA